MMTKNTSLADIWHTMLKNLSVLESTYFGTRTQGMNPGRKAGHRAQTHKMYAGAGVKTGKSYAAVITEDKA